ncbi:Chaperone protein HscA [Candidatus Annandia adelgestsuga]|uniref:Chaperone protein HscA n=1 Tax=Candidatus Annandia adelgestsuga TaxID=1302411 RepID=A0A3S9J7T0_9ENTR|nr:Hsp70 family protein [Candidatus Annandia adelgestsuga]AZP36346.1 Chaperone protein HscA [Candidatus Annandia adelgestsuga]
MLNKKKITLGIDLGTTYSLVSSFFNNKIKILTDTKGRFLLPSIASYNKLKSIIGWKLFKKKYKFYNILTSIKRIIGINIDDINIKFYNNFLYSLKSINKNIFINTNIGLINIINVYIDILKTLKIRSEYILNINNIKDVVITVPAYFNNEQINITKDAANLSNLNLLKLLNEPTSAAIAYGVYKKINGLIAVYDLGGGTFDISILKIDYNGFYEVLAIGGNNYLGGDDIDFLIVSWLIKKLNLKNVNNKIIIKKLKSLAIKIKLKLTYQKKFIINYNKYQIEIYKKDLENIIEPLINYTLLICYETIKNINIKVLDIKNVILVGGSTRIPFIKNKIQSFFKCNLLNNINPDKVVSIGAAIHANEIIKNKYKKVLLLDVIPISLGIETIGGVVEKIIYRNTKIPISCTKEFTTFKDNQTTMSIKIIQGENNLVSKCKCLSKFILTNIPPLPSGKIKIFINFKIDHNGLLNVKIQEKSTGIKKEIKIYNLYKNRLLNYK